MYESVSGNKFISLYELFVCSKLTLPTICQDFNMKLTVHFSCSFFGEK